MNSMDGLKTSIRPLILQMSIKKLLPIVYECNNYIVVNKPYGMFSQPGTLYLEDGSRQIPPVVLSQLLESHGSNDSFSSEWRTIHRLDACVTGGMLIARNKNAASQFSRNLKKGGSKGFKIKRRYVALVGGETAKEYSNDNGLISSIGMISKYKRFDENCMIIELVTGRKRQIRRHLSESVKTPILNDTKFNGIIIAGADPGQIALHSACVTTTIGLQTRQHLIPMIHNNNGILWKRKYLDKKGHFITPIREILLQEW